MNFQEFMAVAPAHRVVGVRVFQDNCPVFSHDFDEEERRNVYSVSKSFTATAVGYAIEEGIISLNERIIDAFPDQASKHPCAYLEALTVRHALTMSMGQDQAYLMGDTRPFLGIDDWVSYVLSRPFVDAPGTKFLYTNAAAYLVGMIIQHRAGCTLADYLTPRLFVPLGLQRPSWETDPNGMTFGASGLFLCITELAKFGMLYLNQGTWEGKRVLPDAWIDQFTAAHIDNGHHGYGYQFWRGAYDSYRADGKFGQYVIVMPKQKVVVALNAECRTQGELLADIDRYILAQFINKG